MQRLMKIVRRRGGVESRPQALSQHLTVQPIPIRQRQQLDQRLRLPQPPTPRHRPPVYPDGKPSKQRDLHLRCLSCHPRHPGHSCIVNLRNTKTPAQEAGAPNTASQASTSGSAAAGGGLGAKRQTPSPRLRAGL